MDGFSSTARLMCSFKPGTEWASWWAMVAMKYFSVFLLKDVLEKKKLAVTWPISPHISAIV